MPAAHLLPVEASTESLPRKRFTREEVDRLIDSGFFVGQRYELIDGDLIDKMGQNPPHAYTIGLVLKWLLSLFDVDRIRVQLSMEAGAEDRQRSVPEPDLVVLKETKRDYRYRHPNGDELVLAVEVSDTTVGFDRGRKSTIYARAGVPEYWVLDLNRRKLMAYRESDGAEYRNVHTYSENEVVSMQGRSESVTVSTLLPELD